MPSPPPSVVLPLWRGRRGWINTLACGVLGLLGAAALWLLAERAAVEPACAAYGQSHGWVYVDYKVYSAQRHGSAACVFRAGAAGTRDISLREAASYFTDLWVGMAFSLELTVPAFILLFAVARTGLYFAVLRRRGARADG
jgi:hypothetical protein